jgi:hypothetical protein
MNADLAFWWLGLPTWAGGSKARDLFNGDQYSITNETLPTWAGGSKARDLFNGDQYSITNETWKPTLRGDFGLTFPGNGYIDADAAIGRFATESSGSISVWFRTVGMEAHGIILSASDASDALSDLSIMMYHTGSANFQLRFIVRENAVPLLYASIGASGAYDDGDWHHLVVSVGPFGNRYAVDGRPVTATYINGSAATQRWFNTVNNIDQWNIGVRVDNNGTEFHWKGDIADVAVWNQPLSVAAATQRYMDSRTGYQRSLNHAMRWLPVKAAAPSGAITGSTSITFAASGDVTADGVLAGSVSLTFAATGDLAAKGAVAGNAVLTFATNGDLGAAGSLAGSSSIAFAASGNLAAAGELAGSSSITFGASGNLGSTGALAGSTSLVFAASGDVAGVGALAGGSSLTFAASGSLASPGALAGSTSLTFAGSADLTGMGVLIGDALLAFAATGNLRAGGVVLPVGLLHSGHYSLGV